MTDTATTDQENSWIRGEWMQTFTGRQFFPFDPKPEEIDPIDVAHALSLLCRYGGHVRRFYSVAEHCVHVSRAVHPDVALAALLHDAPEAYLGDVVRPLKRELLRGPYGMAEAKVEAAIALRFGLWDGRGLAPLMDAEVKDADNRILLDERAALLGTSPAPWVVEDLEPLGVDVVGWYPEEAEAHYLRRLRELAGDRFTP